MPAPFSRVVSSPPAQPATTMTVESTKVRTDALFSRSFIVASQILSNPVTRVFAITVRSLFLDAQPPIGLRPVVGALFPRGEWPAGATDGRQKQSRTQTCQKDSARLFAERLQMHTHGRLIFALLFEPLELSPLAVKLSLVRVGLMLLFGLFLFLSLHLVTDQGASS